MFGRLHRPIAAQGLCVMSQRAHFFADTSHFCRVHRQTLLGEAMKTMPHLAGGVSINLEDVTELFVTSQRVRFRSCVFTRTTSEHFE